jgi:predicted metalloprotease with PDZ domain
MLHRILRAVTLLTVLFVTLCCYATEAVRYDLGFEAWNTHMLDVAIQASGLDGKQVSFALPFWAPGVYIAEEFAVYVQDFQAEDASGKPLAWHKTDGQTWQVDLHGSNGVTIHYRFYANSMPFRGAQYNDSHVSLTGAAVWMYMVDGKDRSATLHIGRARLPNTWKIATGLTRDGQDSYEADNYDAFADCPIEIGDYAEKSFVARGTTYHLVVHDEGDRADFSEFAVQLKNVIEKGVVPILAPAVSGPTAAPFPEYWFIIHLSPSSFISAGVEHRNSTMIAMGSSWDDHSATHHDSVRNLYGPKISLATHEFFHSWNVKRLRPIELGPFDYAHPVHTESLWISEGLTEYYTDAALLRSGYWKPKQYIDRIAEVATALEAEPGRAERSVAETSWDTWFGFSGAGVGGFGPGFSNNLDNTNYSYYDSGHILGVLLDLELRHATGNRKSLDDWMRLMYTRYALPKPGFTPEDAIRAASEVAGIDMREFFDRYVTGKQPFPYDRDFAYAGLQVVRSGADLPWLGLVTRSGGNHEAMIANIVPGSPAERADLDRGDTILAINGKAVDGQSVSSMLHNLAVNLPVKLTVVHGGSLQTRSVTAIGNPHPTITFQRAPNTTAEQDAIYASMVATAGAGAQ